MANYKASKDVLQAQKLKKQAENAVKNYGDFKYGNQKAYDQAMNDILNRKSFSYDLNGDALYQQYKDMYMTQGKLAMQDTMGQAAALTGGYGNSYAASVGNQAYQGYLQQLNGVIPELYNLALSAYNAEGDRLNNNFNLLATDRSTQYGEWNDKYNRLVTDRGYYSDSYNNAYSQDYSKYRDAVADAQWQKQFNLSVANSRRSSGGGEKTYAITDYADVTKTLRKNIEAVRESAYDYNTAKMPIQWYAQKNPDVFNKKTGAYLDSLIEAGKISPAVADLLMEEYSV